MFESNLESIKKLYLRRADLRDCKSFIRGSIILETATVNPEHGVQWVPEDKIQIDIYICSSLKRFPLERNNRKGILALLESKRTHLLLTMSAARRPLTC